MNFWNKKIWKIPMVVIMSVLAIGLVSAGVLTYFGTVSNTVTVTQAVALTGTGCTNNACTDSTTVSGGETVTSTTYTLTSSTTVPAPLSVDSTVTPDEGQANTVVYMLSATGVQGTEDRVHVSNTQAGVATLSDISTINFKQYVAAGYIGHVDVLIDVDGDGVSDDALVFEYDKVSAPSDQLISAMAYTRDSWVTTFDDKGGISDSSKAWLSSGAAGPVGGAGFVYGTLSDWKLGNVDGSITGATAVVGLEFEIDNWIEDSAVNMKDLQVNGNNVTQFTLQAGRDMDFTVNTKFPLGSTGTYTIDSSVTIH